MKVDKQAIMDYALNHFLNYTIDPFDAFVNGLNKWMKKEGVMLISEQEYACLMEMKKRYDADQEESGEALPSLPTGATN